MDYVGKICPYCKTEFKENDDIVICSNCEMPHHKECWIENKACTTFGCTGTISSYINNNELLCLECKASYKEGEEICTFCHAPLPKAHERQQEYYNDQNQQNYNYEELEDNINKGSDFQYNSLSNNYTNEYIEPDIGDLIATNQNYYLDRFEYMNDHNVKIRWNWVSAFFGGYWYAYRRMYTIQILYYAAVFIPVIVFEIIADTNISEGIDCVIFILSGMFGNLIYKNHVDKRMNIANNMEPGMRRKYISDNGGTNVAALSICMIFRLIIFCTTIILNHVIKLK